MIILTLFGTTTGLELVPISSSEIPAALKFENSWIEITERQIVTTADNDAFVVFRKIIGSNVLTWVGLYRPAYEFNGSRSDCFYGAGALLIDCVTDVRTLTGTLRDLANQIQATTMNGDRFVRRIHDARHEIKIPSFASSLTNNLTRIAGGCHPSGDMAFIVSNGNANEVIDWTQRLKSAYGFSKLFIGTADQVPGHSGQSSVVVHRSLSLAIESAYLICGNELHAARNKLSMLNNEQETLKQKLNQAVSDLSKKIDALNFAAGVDKSNITQLQKELTHAKSQVAQLKSQSSNEQKINQGTIQPEINYPIISSSDDFALDTYFPPSKVDNFSSPKGKHTLGTNHKPVDTLNHSSTNSSSSEDSHGWLNLFVRIFKITIVLVFAVFLVLYLYNHLYKGANINCNKFDFNCSSAEALPTNIAPEVPVDSSLKGSQWPFKPSCSDFPLKESWDQSTNLCSENDSKLKLQTKEQNKTDKPRSRER